MPRAWTVLLIEDDLADAELLQAAFEDVAPDVRLEVAERGAAGLRAAGEAKPDLIVLDLALPDVPGLTVLAGLRQDDRTRRIPVVVLSRFEDDGNVWRAYQQYASAFMAKPHDYAGLLRLVEAMHGFWFRFALFARSNAEPPEGEGMPDRRRRPR